MLILVLVELLGDCDVCTINMGYGGKEILTKTNEFNLTTLN